MANKPLTFTAVFGIALALLSSAALANPSIQHWQTDNGARIFLVEAHELPMVDIQVWFNAGAARDGDKPGTALLTNGLLSEGAGGLSADELAEQFDAIGARYGNDSQRDVSQFTLRTLSDRAYLNKAVDLLARILTKPDFPEDAFNREKNRLAITLKANKQNPAEIAEENFYLAVFGDHPYSNMPTGNEGSLKAITRKDLVDFYKRYYIGNNAVVAIVGDVSRKQAEALTERIVGKLETGEPVAMVPPVGETHKSGLGRIEHPSSQTHILMGLPGMKRGDPDYFSLYVGNQILGGSGLVSRISNEVREKRGLAYSAYSYFIPMAQPGPFILGLQTANKTADKALKVMKQTLKEFRDQGPTEQELNSVKKNLTGGFPLRVASNSKVVSYVAMIGFYGLPLDYLDQFTANVEAVTLESIKDAWQRRIDPDKLSIIVVGGDS